MNKKFFVSVLSTLAILSLTIPIVPNTLTSNINVAYAEKKAFVKPEVKIDAVEGQGLDSNAAKLDAFRNAIAQALGVYVTSDTVVEDFVTKSDKIKTKINGFVKNAKKLDEKKQEGIVTAVYEVVVSTEPLKEDFESVMGREFEAVGHPRVCVVGKYEGANRLETEANVIAVTAMNRALINRGYKVVDQWQIAKLRKEDKELAKMVVNKDAYTEFAGKLADKLKADIYVTTFGSVQSNKASVSTKMYNSYTAQIFGDDTGYGNVTGSTWADTKKAVDDAVTESMERILPLMSKHWQGVITSGQEYVVIFENVADSKQRRNLKKALKDLDGVQNVEEITAVPTKVEFSVYASGRPDELTDSILDALDEAGLKIFKDEAVRRGGRIIFILTK